MSSSYIFMAFSMVFCLLSRNLHAHNGHDSSSPSYDTMMHSHMFSLPIMIGFDGMVMYGIAYEHRMGAMNHHGNDHGSMNAGNQNMHDGTGNHHSPMHQGVAWHLMPMISFGGDKLKKIIKTGEQMCDDTGCGDAYKVVRASHIDIGTGMMIMGLMPSHWFVHAGIMPLVGGEHYVEKHFNSYEKTKQNPHLTVPFSLSDLDEWSIGDTLSYTTRGGAMLSAGVGFTIFCQASGMYMYQHIKKIRYQKVSPSDLKVDIAHDNKHGEGFLAGTPITFAMAHLVQSKQKINSLVFDFNEPEAIDKFEDFLAGKLDINSALSLQAGVKSINKTKTKTRGSMSNGIAGLPFVYQLEKDKMNSQTKSSLKDILPDREVNGFSYASMGAHSSNYRGILSKHKRNQTMFMTMSLPIEGSSYKYLGSFKWFYEHDRINAEELKEKIAATSDRYGLIPPVLDGINFEQKGYARCEIDLKFNSNAIKRILERINNTSRAGAQTYLNHEIKQFFLSDSNPTRICSHRFACLRKTIVQTRKQVQQIYKTAEEIDFLKRTDQIPKLNKVLTELGNLVTKNRFTLHYFTDNLRDTRINLSIKGEFFDPIDAEMRIDFN